MKRVRWGALTILLGLLVWMMGPVWAQTASSNVTIGVGDTILQVSGQTSPSAFVTISRDGGVIGTTTADAGGLFSSTFPAQTPGLHDISIFAQTPAGVTTDTVTNTINITEHGTTSMQVFLPTTLIIDNPNPALGQPLQLHGEAAPNSTVIVFIDNTAYASEPSGADGSWQLTIDTTLFTAGTHSLFARVIDSMSQISSPTSSRSFTIAAPPDVPGTPAAPGGSSQAPDTDNGSIRPPRVPEIIFPRDGDVWRQPSITVRGLGDPGTQIEVWDGDNIIGSIFADDSGQWSLQLDLLNKEYLLRVRACRQGVCGDFSATHRFSYQPEGPTFPAGEPLYITLPRAALVVVQGEPFDLYANVSNGQPPYSSTTDWGDDAKADNAHPSQQLALPHRYLRAGKYSVQLEVRDSQGRKGRVFATVHVLPAQTSLVRLWAFALAISFLVVLALGGVIYQRRYRHRRLRD